ANLTLLKNLAPAHGVYAGRAFLDDANQHTAAAIHVGPNATFGETNAGVEAHLLDFHGELYDRNIELEFVEFLRPTRAFASVDELVTQIRDDVERTRMLIT